MLHRNLCKTLGRGLWQRNGDSSSAGKRTLLGSLRPKMGKAKRWLKRHSEQRTQAFGRGTFMSVCLLEFGLHTPAPFRWYLSEGGYGFKWKHPFLQHSCVEHWCQGQAKQHVPASLSLLRLPLRKGLLF